MRTRTRRRTAPVASLTTKTPTERAPAQKAWTPRRTAARPRRSLRGHLRPRRRRLRAVARPRRHREPRLLGALGRAPGGDGHLRCGGDHDSPGRIRSGRVRPRLGPRRGRLEPSRPGLCGPRPRSRPPRACRGRRRRRAPPRGRTGGSSGALSPSRARAVPLPAPIQADQLVDGERRAQPVAEFALHGHHEAAQGVLALRVDRARSGTRLISVLPLEHRGLHRCGPRPKLAGGCGSVARGRPRTTKTRSPGRAIPSRRASSSTRCGRSKRTGPHPQPGIVLTQGLDLRAGLAIQTPGSQYWRGAEDRTAARQQRHQEAKSGEPVHRSRPAP